MTTLKTVFLPYCPKPLTGEETLPRLPVGKTGQAVSGRDQFQFAVKLFQPARQLEQLALPGFASVHFPLELKADLTRTINPEPFGRLGQVIDGACGKGRLQVLRLRSPLMMITGTS